MAGVSVWITRVHRARTIRRLANTAATRVLRTTAGDVARHVETLTAVTRTAVTFTVVTRTAATRSAKEPVTRSVIRTVATRIEAIRSVEIRSAALLTAATRSAAVTTVRGTRVATAPTDLTGADAQARLLGSVPAVLHVTVTIVGDTTVVRATTSARRPRLWTVTPTSAQTTRRRAMTTRMVQVC